MMKANLRIIDNFYNGGTLIRPRGDVLINQSVLYRKFLRCLETIFICNTNVLDIKFMNEIVLM